MNYKFEILFMVVTSHVDLKLLGLSIIKSLLLELIKFNQLLNNIYIIILIKSNVNIKLISKMLKE